MTTIVAPPRTPSVTSAAAVPGQGSAPSLCCDVGVHPEDPESTGPSGPLVTVVVVDDERLVLSGFQLILDSDPRISVVATCDGPDAVTTIRAHRPDVVLLDIHMPAVSGLDVLRELAADGDRPRVVMLTTFASDDATAAALTLGADGFLLKDLDADDLIGCVRQVAAGRTVFSDGATELLRAGLEDARAVHEGRLGALSGRERDVLNLLGAGLSNSEIADRLCLSPSTVKDHVSRILEKTGCDNRTQAAVLAAQAGLDPQAVLGAAG